MIFITWLYHNKAKLVPKTSVLRSGSCVQLIVDCGDCSNCYNRSNHKTIQQQMVQILTKYTSYFCYDKQELIFAWKYLFLWQMLIDNLPKLSFFRKWFFRCSRPERRVVTILKVGGDQRRWQKWDIWSRKINELQPKSNLIFIQPWEIISTLVSNYLPICAHILQL